MTAKGHRGQRMLDSGKRRAAQARLWMGKGFAALGIGVALLGVTAGTARAEPAIPDDTLVLRLRQADPAHGERAFRKCRLCHKLDRGVSGSLGPTLYGVVGASVAGDSGYRRYSEALRTLGGLWTLERLDAYLKSPKSAVPGTSMAFVGIADPAERAALINWMNAHSDNPVEY